MDKKTFEYMQNRVEKFKSFKKDIKKLEHLRENLKNINTTNGSIRIETWNSGGREQIATLPSSHSRRTMKEAILKTVDEEIKFYESKMEEI